MPVRTTDQPIITMTGIMNKTSYNPIYFVTFVGWYIVLRIVWKSMMAHKKCIWYHPHVNLHDILNSENQFQVWQLFAFGFLWFVAKNINHRYRFWQLSKWPGRQETKNRRLTFNFDKKKYRRSILKCIENLNFVKNFSIICYNLGSISKY